MTVVRMAFDGRNQLAVPLALDVLDHHVVAEIQHQSDRAPNSTLRPGSSWTPCADLRVTPLVITPLSSVITAPHPLPCASVSRVNFDHGSRMTFDSASR